MGRVAGRRRWQAIAATHPGHRRQGAMTMTASTSDPRTAVITGAARGIGLAAARRLARDGHRVLLVIRDHDALELAGRAIPDAATHLCDITDRSEPDAAFAAAAEAFGPVEVLVNNAGVADRTAVIEEQTDADWERAMAVMLTAPFRWSRAAVAIMKGRGWGRIINVASVAGKEGNPNILPYSAAKAGLRPDQGPGQGGRHVGHPGQRGRSGGHRHRPAA